MRSTVPLVLAATLVACGGLRSPDVAAPSTQAPLPAPRVAAGALDARVLLSELAARALRLGAGAPSLVASAQAIDNGWVGGFVDVPRDDCILGYARGSSSIDDVDAAIYSEEGTTLAVDEGRDVHPTVLMCPPIPTASTSLRTWWKARASLPLGRSLCPRIAPSSSLGRSAREGSPAKARDRPMRGPVSTKPFARIARSSAEHGRSFGVSR